MRGLCRPHYRGGLRSGELPLRQPNAPNGAGADLLRRLIRTGRASRRRRERVQECLPWPYGRSGGYARISRTNDYDTTLVHAIVCREVWGPPPFRGAEACHDCGGGADACVEATHLYWGTHGQNMADMVEHGTSPRGERHGKNILTEDQVRMARRLYRKGWTMAEIARRFAVRWGTIQALLTGRSWGWLK